MASLVVNVLRARDLLHAQLELINLSLDATDATQPRLKRTAGGPAFVVVRLPAQHIAEETFTAGASRVPLHQGFLACPSRIAFEIPTATTSIPFTVDGILNLITLVPPVTPEPALGTAAASVIEFPDRLLLVPTPGTRLFHRSKPHPGPENPATGIEWTELWHTRVGSVGSGDGGRGGTRFRAIANPRDGTDRPATTTLNREQRREIVARCSNSAPNPHLVTAPHVMLTSLGASAQLRSGWPSTASPVLSTWDHEAVTGRDAFVRVTEQGFLFPFGHRATRETITRRDFSSLNPSAQVAELRKQVVVSIEEPEKRYDVPGVYDHDGREMPFKQIRIVSSPGSLLSELTPIRLGVTATDGNDRLVECQLTALFVTHRDAANAEALRRVLDRYASLNTADLPPQQVALADDRDARGDTSLMVTGLTFAVKLLPVGGAIQPPFAPFMQSARVSIPSVEQMFASVPATGGTATPAIRTLTLHDTYLRNGFPAGDAKQVFATFTPAMPALTVPAERAGGLTAPTFQPMDGFSRSRGLVSDVNGFVRDSPIDPTQLIGRAKLLGVIALDQLIDRAVDAIPVGNPDALFATIERPDVFATRPVLTTVRKGAEVETRFLWKPRIKTASLPAPLTTTPAGPMTLIVKGRVRTGRAAGAAATFEVDGKLLNFGLAFGDLLTVHFRQVAFTSGGGKKLDVKTDIANVTFGSGLAFVEKISRLIPTNSLGDAPAIQPRPDGVVVSFGVAIPSFAIGVLSIQNIALKSSISLPFVDKPASVRFSLSERSHPFLVSVSVFGGTGFFALELRTDKTARIEAAIEFGGIVSINLLGIVRGGVYVFAGVFVAIDTSTQPSITGYLRLGGYVDVAGLVSVSIEVYIALTYQIDDKVLLGEGRVTVSVKLLFFSLSRSFSVSRRIAGFGDAPTVAGLSAVSGERAELPTFTSTMSGMQWEKYCGAFA